MTLMMMMILMIIIRLSSINNCISIINQSHFLIVTYITFNHSLFALKESISENEWSSSSVQEQNSRTTTNNKQQQNYSMYSPTYHTYTPTTRYITLFNLFLRRLRWCSACIPLKIWSFFVWMLYMYNFKSTMPPLASLEVCKKNKKYWLKIYLQCYKPEIYVNLTWRLSKKFEKTRKTMFFLSNKTAHVLVLMSPLPLGSPKIEVFAGHRLRLLSKDPRTSYLKFSNSLMAFWQYLPCKKAKSSSRLDSEFFDAILIFALLKIARDYGSTCKLDTGSPDNNILVVVNLCELGIFPRIWKITVFPCVDCALLNEITPYEPRKRTHLIFASDTEMPFIHLVHHTWNLVFYHPGKFLRMSAFTAVYSRLFSYNSL